jgi:4,5-DOPA dioxygenase extradiol
MTELPALFVSHGAPTLIITPGPAREFLSGLGSGIPQPTAILVVSAHWETGAPAVSSMAAPDTIYDFYGFPRELYTIRYPAPGAEALAERTAELLTGAGFATQKDTQRGLDHGAWVPLKLMYPTAMLPVTQLSIQTHLGVQHHYRLGQALRPLREEGVLILASGGTTHNLREFGRHTYDAEPPAWVSEFRDWLAQCAAAGDVEELLRYRERAPYAVRNHPTEDHFVPFFAALGAGSAEPRATRIHTSTTFGILAMDAYRFD